MQCVFISVIKKHCTFLASIVKLKCDIFTRIVFFSSKNKFVSLA